MTKETLISMGLTNEQAVRVMKALDGNYVTKKRFNEVNAKWKLAKKVLEEREESQISASCHKDTGKLEVNISCILK